MMYYVYDPHNKFLQRPINLSYLTSQEEVDGGAILAQEAVAVLPSDTEDTLAKRILTREHVAFPRALELVASGKAWLGEEGKVCWQV